MNKSVTLWMVAGLVASSGLIGVLLTSINLRRAASQPRQHVLISAFVPDAPVARNNTPASSPSLSASGLDLDSEYEVRTHLEKGMSVEMVNQIMGEDGTSKEGSFGVEYVTYPSPKGRWLIMFYALQSSIGGSSPWGLQNAQYNCTSQ